MKQVIKFLTKHGLHTDDWTVVRDIFLTHNEVIYGHIDNMSEEDAVKFCAMMKQLFPDIKEDMYESRTQYIYGTFCMLEDKLDFEHKAKTSERILLLAIIAFIIFVISKTIIHML